MRFVFILSLTVSLMILFVSSCDLNTPSEPVHDNPWDPQNPNRPRTPEGLAAEALSASDVSLSWRDLSGNEQGFDIFEKSNRDSGFYLVSSVDSNVASVLLRNKHAESYEFQVRAFNLYGSSDPTNLARVIMLDSIVIDTAIYDTTIFDTLVIDTTVFDTVVIDTTVYDTIEVQDEPFLGTAAFVGGGRVFALDVTNPDSIKEIGGYGGRSGYFSIHSFARFGDYLYCVAERFGLLVLDISDPLKIKRKCFLRGITAEPRRIFNYNDFLIVQDVNDTLVRIYNVEDVFEPSLIFEWQPHEDDRGSIRRIHLNGNKIYLITRGSGGQIQTHYYVLDISDIEHPEEMFHYQIEIDNGTSEIAGIGDFVYLWMEIYSGEEWQKWIVKYNLNTDERIDSLRSPFDENYFYLEENYLFHNSIDGTGIYDLSRPPNLISVGILPESGTNSKAFLINDSFLFTAAENGYGLSIYEIENEDTFRLRGTFELSRSNCVCLNEYREE